MDLPQHFNELCQQLQIFLNFTEESLNISQERFKQAQSVLKPWPNLKIDPNEIECLCKSVENIRIAANPEDLVLINNISKVLTNAQTIRSRTTPKQTNIKSNIKPNTKPNAHNKLINTVKSCSKLPNQKTKSIPNKSISAQTIPNKDTHKPTCPLYNREIINKPFLTISEALLIYKTPFTLTKTIKNCTKIMNSTSTKHKSKDKFFQLFNTQNENLWTSYEENHTSVSVLTKYISTYHTLKRKTEQEMTPWLLLNNELQTFHCLDSKLITKQFWNGILNNIVDLIPILNNAEFETRQMLYIFKIIKTICNLLHCNVAKVPIFRLK